MRGGSPVIGKKRSEKRKVVTLKRESDVMLKLNTTPKFSGSTIDGKKCESECEG